MTDADEPEQAGVPARAETSFEAELDDEPPATHPPVYVDVVSRDHDRRPIVPAQFRPENLKATAKRAAGRQGHRLGYHGLRLPLLYAPLTAWYAPIGAARLAGRLVRWTLDMDARPLQHAAVRREDVDEWLKVVRQRSAHSARRLFLVSILAVPVAAAVALAAWLVPAWIQALVVICAAAGLARLGRPPGKPIITPAVIAPQYRKLNSDIVLRAYHAAKLGDPDKPNQKIEFLTPMADVKGQGCQVTIALPFGKTFAEHVVPARSKIASGLDVSSNQVFLSGDKTSDRRHTLYVAYVDPLSIPAGPTPLLDCKPRDIWKPAPFGLDERGDRVEILLLWISILVGAQPRKGKTFSARLLALYAALDPYVRLFIADGKNSPDWRKFALVADMVIFGTHPNRDGDPVDQLLWMLRGIKKHIEKVNEILSELPVDVCPEGKLTRALARDPRYPDLRVWLLIMEEFQLYYELDDKDANRRDRFAVVVHHGRRPIGRGHHPVQLAEALRCRSRGRAAAVHPVPGQPRRAVRAQVRQPDRFGSHPRRGRLLGGLRRIVAAQRAGVPGYRLPVRADRRHPDRADLPRGTSGRGEDPPGRAPVPGGRGHAVRHGRRGGRVPAGPRRPGRCPQRVLRGRGVGLVEAARGPDGRADAGALRRPHPGGDLRPAPRAAGDAEEGQVQGCLAVGRSARRAGAGHEKAGNRGGAVIGGTWNFAGQPVPGLVPRPELVPRPAEPDQAERHR
jgi:hypothetical protein